MHLSQDGDSELTCEHRNKTSPSLTEREETLASQEEL